MAFTIALLGTILKIRINRVFCNPGDTSTIYKGVELNIVKYIVRNIYQNYKCYLSDVNIIIYIF